MTDTTELAQRVERIISDMKLKHGGSDTYAPVMKWGEFLALVEALEKAQRANGHLREQSAEWERKAISNFEECAKLSQRVEELESRAVTVENLQESAYRAGLTAGWNLGLANNNDGFNKCLAAHAAGIKVEAE
ncbi:TPA: hypothetical protein ACXP13_004364 [Klebsiella pneumoniae]|uniref:hypothetical protein n=1 Tax=Klebsiella pneumoniae TaxID=573 RepID=UPI001A932AE5|nr:hypothetical protein [Klebsiella pneumoniae]HDW3812070.1 hypothetical protein [Klebsiella pneumoniae]